MNIPKVESLVVNQDLCTGCGTCVTQCETGSIMMDWNTDGFRVPVLSGDCTEASNCIKVCPFSPIQISKFKSEDELATLHLTEATKYNDDIGRYNDMFVGYSKEFRTSSSSGGMATYFFQELFELDLVDQIIVVTYNEDSSAFYKYSIISSLSDLTTSSKTRYYPVSLDEALNEIKHSDTRIAIVGVGCFLKSIRLLQSQDASFSQRIKFLIGIICGGLKSKYYTDFLAKNTLLHQQNYSEPEYRLKDHNSQASDYYFSAKFDGNEEKLRMRTLGDMWGTGYFKASACDFCEDVASELADVSLGDAWLNPFVQDGKGTSIVVSRSKVASDILKEGISTEKLVLDHLSEEQFLLSQRGSYNHRHAGLKYRLDRRMKNGARMPYKRERNLKNISFTFKMVQYFREQTRRSSIELWKNNPYPNHHSQSMRKHLLMLRIATKINHLTRKV